MPQVKQSSIKSVLQVLQSIPTCPAVPPLTHTSCGLIRKLAPWLASSGLEQPEVLQLVPPLFRHTVQALKQNLSAGGGSLAFAQLCRLCAPTVAEHCSDIMVQSFDAAVASQTWQGREVKGLADADGRQAPSVNQAGPLEEEDVNSIIEGTATVLSHQASRGDAQVLSFLPLESSVDFVTSRQSATTRTSRCLHSEHSEHPCSFR